MSEKKEYSAPPPGWIIVASAKTGRDIHVNGERICAYGTEGVTYYPKLPQTWIALQGREKLLWTTTSMEEIAERIRKEFEK